LRLFASCPPEGASKFRKKELSSRPHRERNVRRTAMGTGKMLNVELLRIVLIYGIYILLFLYENPN